MHLWLIVIIVTFMRTMAGSVTFFCILSSVGSHVSNHLLYKIVDDGLWQDENKMAEMELLVSNIPYELASQLVRLNVCSENSQAFIMLPSGIDLPKHTGKCFNLTHPGIIAVITKIFAFFKSELLFKYLIAKEAEFKLPYSKIITFSTCCIGNLI